MTMFLCEDTGTDSYMLYRCLISIVTNVCAALGVRSSNAPIQGMKKSCCLIARFLMKLDYAMMTYLLRNGRCLCVWRDLIFGCEFVRLRS
jgi:hypothetical protein